MNAIRKNLSLMLVIAIIFTVAIIPITASAATSASKKVKGSANSNINYTFTSSATVYSGSGWSYFWGKKTQLHMKNEGKQGVIYQICDKKGIVMVQGLLNPGKVVGYYIGGNGVKYTIRFSLGTLVPKSRSSSVFIWTDAGSVS